MVKFTLRLKTTIYDTGTLRSGDREVGFFKEVIGKPVGSVADLSEAELVGWLMRNRTAKGLILSELGLSANAICVQQARYPFIKDQNQKPGDIDLLVCDALKPQCAVVVEFKKIKARFSRDNETINKLKALGRVVSQVEGLSRLGFHRTYLGIIVVVDGREKDELSFAHRGVSLDTTGRILEIADGIAPPLGVGVLYIEVVQAINKHIDEAGMVGVGQILPAALSRQNGDLTQVIANYLACKNSQLPSS